MKQWFRNFGKTAEQLAELPEERTVIFENRLKLMNTSTEDRDPETGFIKFNPKVEGRVVNIREALTHED